MLYSIYPRLIKFPASEKFCLCQNIKNCFFEILKYIALGDKVRSKRTVYLQEADAHLEVLKVLIKLSKQRKYLSVKHFESIDERLSEIGRMISAYIKSSTK